RCGGLFVRCGLQVAGGEFLALDAGHVDEAVSQPAEHLVAPALVGRGSEWDEHGDENGAASAASLHGESPSDRWRGERSRAASAPLGGGGVSPTGLGQKSVECVMT